MRSSAPSSTSARARSTAAIVGVVVAAGVISACGSSDDDRGRSDPATSGAQPGCGVLSGAALDGLTGGASMESFSGIVPRSERLDTAMTCSMIEKGSGDLKVRLRISDTADAEQAAARARSIRTLIDRKDCSAYAALQPAGYLCVIDGETTAGVALSKRSITLSVTPAPQQPLTRAAVTRAFDQVDRRLDAYDAKHS